MRRLLVLLLWPISLGARAQCLSFQDMRSLLGRTLSAEDQFMTSRGFPYGEASGGKIRWYGRDNGLTTMLTYPSGSGQPINRVEFTSLGSNKCFRSLLSQLHRAPGFVAAGDTTLRRPGKMHIRFYTGPDCGVMVYDRAILVHTLAQYRVSRHRLARP